MWSRSELKSKAKNELHTSYWQSFLVSGAGNLLGASAGSYTSVSMGASIFAMIWAWLFPLWMIFGNRYSYYWRGYDFSEVMYYLDDNRWIAFLVPLFIFLFVFLFISAVALCFGIFVSNPVGVGVADYYISAPRGQRNFGKLFSAFGKGRYSPAVKAQFTTNLFIFFWSLLFIVPGIYKSYQWRMVPYIIADNPEMSPGEARELSKAMTNGHKGAMFVLDLSFIGWSLLAAMACGIGYYFLFPYVEATWAQLYYVLRGQMAGGPPWPGVGNSPPDVVPVHPAPPPFVQPHYYGQGTVPPEGYPPQGTYPQPPPAPPPSRPSGGAPAGPAAEKDPPEST